MADQRTLFWILFNLFVLLMLALDLGVFHRRGPVSLRAALLSAGFWVMLAVTFGAGVYFWMGRARALEFATGYLVEGSLSIDNLFVFLLIFRHFRVPPAYQHKVLFWGIIGALVTRGLFILAGVTLVTRFEWSIYVLGAFLLYAGVKLAIKGEPETDPEQSALLRIVRRFMPLTPDYVEGRFFVRSTGLYATPLLLVLVVVESTDIVFAIDSIPAILGITRDAFIVYTSNVFAVLGLRSMYFALAGLIEAFRYLPYGLSLVLAFIGAKMLASHWYQVPTEYALGVVAALLAISVVLSLLLPTSRQSAVASRQSRNSDGG